MYILTDWVYYGDSGWTEMKEGKVHHWNLSETIPEETISALLSGLKV